VPAASDKTSNGNHQSVRDAFIFVSGELGIDWTSEAYNAVSERGLVPFFYQGLQLGDTSSKEAYDAQFHASHCDVIILAISESDAQQIAQLPIYKELQAGARGRAKILAYVRPAEAQSKSQLMTTEIMPGMDAVYVGDHKLFGQQLRGALNNISSSDP
jgi:hypothetical protein